MSKPQPSLVWLRNGSLFDNSWSITPQGIIRNELVISRLTRKDLMSTITCQASNSNLTRPAASSITLDLNLRPLDVKITSIRRPLSAGKRVELTCQSRGSRPPAIVTWWKGSKRLQHVIEDISSHENLTISSVHFTPSIEDNGKLLSCRADHSILPDSALEDSWMLDVYYAPICKPDQKTVFGVATREPIQVPCQVEANPPKVTFHWQLNNTFKVTEVKNFMSADLMSTAVYAPRTNLGYGQLLCWASNKVGKQKEPCVFNVIPAGPPQTVRNCLVGNQSMDSLVIKCEAGEDGGLEQHFYLEVYNSANGLIQSNLSSTKSPVFEVQGLPMSSTFLLVLYAANAKGKSNSVTLSASTLPFPNKEVNTITPVIAVLIGVVGSLVFTAIAIMMIAKFRGFDHNKDAVESVVNDQWDQEINESEKYMLRDEPNSGTYGIGREGHVSLTLEPRRTPEGDVFTDRCQSDSGSTISSNTHQAQDNNYKRMPRYLLPPQAILKEPSVVILNEDESVMTTETPLINGLYFPQYANAVSY
ncbi:nephrin-like protein, partial [Dinothrombium tinctorium]